MIDKWPVTPNRVAGFFVQPIKIHIMDKKFKKNIRILEENDIHICGEGPVWKEHPNSVELETYTDAGEDMIIDIEEPSRECLEEYIDGFDIDDEVIIWWKNGRDAAHKAGVQFDNIREHYEDYEAYLKELRRVAELLD